MHEYEKPLVTAPCPTCKTPIPWRIDIFNRVTCPNCKAKIKLFKVKIYLACGT